NTLSESLSALHESIMDDGGDSTIFDPFTPLGIPVGVKETWWYLMGGSTDRLDEVIGQLEENGVNSDSNVVFLAFSGGGSVVERVIDEMGLENAVFYRMHGFGENPLSDETYVVTGLLDPVSWISLISDIPTGRSGKIINVNPRAHTLGFNSPAAAKYFMNVLEKDAKGVNFYYKGLHQIEKYDGWAENMRSVGHKVPELYLEENYVPGWAVEMGVEY
ncbi:MAG: hypothetical protein KKH88_02455, partial [Nanoarchaeota archaeon]|nr:hypothetical protein [Nanoarchaeota archaeon]